MYNEQYDLGTVCPLTCYFCNQLVNKAETWLVAFFSTSGLDIRGVQSEWMKVKRFTTQSIFGFTLFT